MSIESPEIWWLAYLALGLIVGLLAGMLGIGGGVVIVPLLVFLYAAEGLAEDRAVHLAIGTSLASIVFTNLSSVRAHHMYGAVLWPVVRRAAPGIIAGTLSGTLLAEAMPTRYLAIIFTVFVVLSTLQMWTERAPKPSRQLPGRFGLSLAGVLVGLLCSLVGVAGGIILVPLLAMCNVPLRNCIGTSAALGLPISMAGALGYVVTGIGKTHLPPFSLGYVYLPALFGLVLGAFITVPLGARIAHRIPVKLLKRLFALFLSILAVKMVHSLF